MSIYIPIMLPFYQHKGIMEIKNPLNKELMFLHIHLDNKLSIPLGKEKAVSSGQISWMLPWCQLKW